MEKRRYAKKILQRRKLILLACWDQKTATSQASLLSAVEFVLKTDNVCFDNLLEVKKGGFIFGD